MAPITRGVPNENRFCFMSNIAFDAVARGSVVKCLTRNPGVLGSSCTGSYGVFVRGNVIG